jgi:hypothetical protein
MLNIPSKYEESYIVRPNSSSHSPIPPALQIDDSTGRISRELWETNCELSPVDIIPPLFSMLMSLAG